MTTMETETKTGTPGTETGTPGKQKPKAKPAPPRSRKGGRPKGSKTKPKPHGVEGPPVPKTRKTPDEYKDTKGAIDQHVKALKVLSDRYRKEHPESKIDVRDPFAETFDPVPPEFFEAILSSSIGMLCTALDCPEGAPDDKQLKNAGKAWSEVTRYFRIEGKWIVLAGAVVVTGGMVGKPIVITVAKKKTAKVAQLHAVPDPTTATPDTGPKEPKP